MRERPILFNGEMVRAILGGRMTQMRSAVKQSTLTSTFWEHGGYQPRRMEDGEMWTFEDRQTGMYAATAPKFRCPYGDPGDRLWVRETYLPTASGAYYRADFSGFAAAGHGAMYGGWKSAKHMPRAASRIALEIVSVRVERLNDGGEYEWVVEFRKQE